MNHTLLGALCLSLAAGIWGGMFVASKYVLDYIPPFSLMVIRYLMAVRCCLPFCVGAAFPGPPRQEATGSCLAGSALSGTW